MKFSIITVCLNNRQSLLQTFDSIDLQRFQSFEHIVVDGASTDGTLELFKSRALSHSNFKYLSEKDSGIYYAMNKGIVRASGEYLYFLNAGDRLYAPSVLEDVAAQASEQDLLYGDVFLETSAGYINRKYPETLGYRFWLTEHMCHQACFFSKKLFDNLGLYNETFRFAADLEVFLRALFKGNASTIRIAKSIAIYNMDGLSSRVELRKRVLDEMALAQRVHLMNLRSRVYGRLVKVYNKVQSIKNSRLRYVLRVLTWPFSGVSLHKEKALDSFFETLPELSESPLRILMLNTYESSGGAAVAASRLHKAFRRLKVDSRMVVLYRSSLDPSVYPAWPKFGFAKLVQCFLHLVENVLVKLDMAKLGVAGPKSFSLESYADIDRLIQIHDPDVVHINWVCNRFLSVKSIGRIQKPIVWTFHDMWAFCGTEHVASNERYVEGYTKTNWDKNKSRFDLNRWAWNRKKDFFFWIGWSLHCYGTE